MIQDLIGTSINTEKESQDFALTEQAADDRLYCNYIANPLFQPYNDRRMAKSIEISIDFAAKRQVWQRMIL